MRNDRNLHISITINLLLIKIASVLFFFFPSWSFQFTVVQRIEPRYGGIYHRMCKSASHRNSKVQFSLPHFLRTLLCLQHGFCWWRGAGFEHRISVALESQTSERRGFGLFSFFKIANSKLKTGKWCLLSWSNSELFVYVFIEKISDKTSPQ